MLPEVLRGYAAATFESADGAGVLAGVRSDVEGFARALTNFSDLREVLSDPTVPPHTRRAVVAELLAGKSTDQARALIAFAVLASPPGELPLIIAELDELLEIPEEPALEAIGSRQRLRGFAERVLEELSGADAIDELEDELFRIARLVEAQRTLRDVLTNQLIAAEARAGVLADLLGSRATRATLRVVSYVLRAGHVRNLVATLDWLVELCAEERGRRVAEVRSAVDLDSSERDRLAEALNHLTGRDVEIRVLEDPGVVGGVLVSVGDLIIDGTVRLRIERLRDALAEPA